MQVRFLLGPAGSGKTFRCLAEIRAALAESPDGPAPRPGAPRPPLVLLAPKQATFQLERQLLGEGTIAGYTRLHVLSFDRLAEFVFDRLQAAAPRLLSAEGRLMVLRALLRRHDGDLKLLGRSARRAGFAQEVGGQLAELQQHQFGPARLRALAAQAALRRELRDKLLDLALLAEKYAGWLQEHDLQDAHCMLDLATDRLRAERNVAESPFLIQGLWFDGFAEMTPQEHALLAAVVPFCQTATLAFCLETEPAPAASWLSIWSAIGKTFQACRDQLAALPGCQVATEILGRIPGRNRFPEDSALGALEAGWSLPVAAEDALAMAPAQISVTACPSPEAEAVLAAREILKFVRGDSGNRFRDCAVLVRNLEPYHPALARTFRRYEIPFFLDRRENVAHHPLAELTRSALRTVAGDWQHDDWFAALKAGFTPLPETELDRLENMALEFGWRGKKWHEPLPDPRSEHLRQRIFPPFERLHRRLQRFKPGPNGEELAEVIRELWRKLDVEAVLQQWSRPETENPALAALHSSLHQTVYDQMLAWLENVALAFPREPMSLRDWLPVLDAGLAALTVGVIPPALDEVLVGAIDRARNPDLKFALLLGVNESVFPAPPAAPVILTNADRDELDQQNAALGPHVLDQISRERYLGYIACTRASRRLAITFCRQDAAGRTLNPSPFIAQLQRSFPSLAVAEFSGHTDPRAAEHAVELIPDIVRWNAQAPVEEPATGQGVLFPEREGTFNIQHSTFNVEGEKSGKRESEKGKREDGEPPLAISHRQPPIWLGMPALRSLAGRLAQLREPDEAEALSPDLAGKIYGPVLKSSVSRLEEFAQCPFRFFVHSGLRAEERKKFELDARERGSFQHEILKLFHDELAAEKKRWRELTPAEARERIGRIAAELAPRYREGLLRADDRSRFAARSLTVALQDFVATLVAWMRGQYGFDPAQAEAGFGLEDSSVPAWEIDLGHGHALALRGRVDRIDLCAVGEQSLAVVMDYKSGIRKLDNLLVEHGIQLQLLAYLAAVRRWPAEYFGGRRIVPAGVFYVNLRGQFESGASRTEVLAEAGAAARLAYQHSGRFDAAYLDHLDRERARDQFRYQLNNDGSVRSNSAESLSGGQLGTLLDQVEAQLRTLGERIYSGAAAVDPYRKGAVTACDYCEYRAICRIDEWSHEYRELRAAGKAAAAGPEGSATLKE